MFRGSLKTLTYMPAWCSGRQEVGIVADSTVERGWADHDRSGCANIDEAEPGLYRCKQCGHGLGCRRQPSSSSLRECNDEDRPRAVELSPEEEAGYVVPDVVNAPCWVFDTAREGTAE
jgi:hypothetical protein